MEDLGKFRVAPAKYKQISRGTYFLNLENITKDKGKYQEVFVFHFRPTNNYLP